MTFRLTWCTDTHLNLLNPLDITKWGRQVALDESPDGILITGDVSEGGRLRDDLEFFAAAVKKPVWFVCGNHDFYDRSIVDVRADLTNRYAPTCQGPWATGPLYLGASPGPIFLTPQTCLIGHDGWYDGIYANWLESKLRMDDYQIIYELRSAGGQGCDRTWECIKALAQESADFIEAHVDEAVKLGATTLYIGTHVPPFPQNSTFRGQQSDANWMPHFSSALMGAMLVEVADRYPEENFVVLCGHSHGSAVFSPRDNLVCETGRARYRHPSVVKTFVL